MMKNILLFIVCSWTTILYAAEQVPAPETPEPEPAVTESPPDDSTGDPETPPEPSLEAFIPSEDISEDLSVSFPADI